MRLSDKAYRILRKKIITLELPPSSLIDEVAMMEALQLGRTPIREALQRLAAEGLVVAIPHRGIWVSEISITDLQKIFEARMAMEGFCARLAAQRVTPRQIEQMELLIERLGEVTDDDSRALMEIDEQFHELLYQASDNSFLADALRRLHALSLRLWYLALDRLNNVREALEQHRAIAAAIRVGDEQQAEALIQDHIASFQREIKALI